MQFTYMIASLLLTASSVLAQPPSCLLAALGSQPNPGDIKGICQNKASDIQRTIQSVCGSDTSAALSSFSDTCKGQGVTVPTVSASSSNRGSNSTSGNNSTTSGSTTAGKSGAGQLTTGLLSVAIAGLVGGATFVL